MYISSPSKTKVTILVFFNPLFLLAFSCVFSLFGFPLFFFHLLPRSLYLVIPRGVKCCQTLCLGHTFKCCQTLCLSHMFKCFQALWHSSAKSSEQPQTVNHLSQMNTFSGHYILLLPQISHKLMVLVSMLCWSHLLFCIFDIQSL